MSKKIKTIIDTSSMPEVKFSLDAQEKFGRSRGVIFEHWSAIPSPIGLKDRGDYRRSDTLDTISENGFIYKKVGCFVATIVGNGHQNQHNGPAEAGIYDNSTARIIIPKFYEDTDQKKEISLLPGDRIYARDIELNVENYQRAEYNPNSSDFLQFPAKCVSRLVDSKGIEYTEGRDFKINRDGNVQWISGKKNPGIDPETGKGRIYSIRYEYTAFWYIQQLINEIRITNTDDAESPARMPYHAMVQREYVYHNQNRKKPAETEEKVTRKTEPTRKNPEPREDIEPNQPEVQVDLRNFTE